MLAILASSDNILPSVPRGRKENVFFTVDNADNVKRRNEGMKGVHLDDCGAWQSGRGLTKSHYVTGEGGKMSCVVLRQGVYCFEKMVARKRTFVPLEPQPDNVLVLCRSYQSLQADAKYTRRITWVDTVGQDAPQVAVYEYVGSFPGAVAHGKNTQEGAKQYRRTNPKVMAAIADQCKTAKPLAIYNGFLANNSGSNADIPRDLTQVQNKKKREKRKERQTETTEKGIIRLNNLTDHFQHINSMMDTQTKQFVQYFLHPANHVGALVLYTEEQIHDLKRFCCMSPTAKSTVIGVDKTFNLGPLHCTTTTFKNLSLIRRTSGDHPIFMGPMYLHGDSDCDTFRGFFSVLKWRLTDSLSAPVFGSDEEAALRKAIRDCFPNSGLMSCALHLKRNALDYLKDSVGASVSQRTPALAAIFGSDGLIDATDPVVFEIRRDRVRQTIAADCPGFSDYFETRLLPKMTNNMTTAAGNNFVSTRWTNNNSESLNHILKLVVDWKSQPLLDLVKKLHDLVRVQYIDVTRAFIGEGNFKLAPGYEKFQVQPTIWERKSDTQRERVLKQFLTTISPVNARAVTSTDGSLTLLRSGADGKKPNQVRRKATARTTTITKKQRTMT